MTGKRLVICADDFGQSRDISLAIASLVSAGRLSAVSCMTASPHWQDAAGLLIEHRGLVDIGLHFTLTQPGLPMALPRLILSAYTRRLDKAAVAAELNRQIDLFERWLGRLPDFVDGHQHVHQLPVVRAVLLEVYQSRLRSHGGYIRCTAAMSERRPARFKSQVISSLGAAALRRQLEMQGIPHNRDFGGVYGFADGASYRDHARRWLKAMHDGGVIMCHPGRAAGPDASDPIAASRAREYRYLAGEDFPADCREFGVRRATGRELGWIG